MSTVKEERKNSHRSGRKRTADINQKTRQGLGGRGEGGEFQADRSGEASLLTVESAALLQLLLLPAQHLRPLAEVCADALPRQCKTGIC